MNAREAIRLNIDLAQMCCQRYLEDLSDEELLRRPTPGCNHINWQLGHLICSDHNMVNTVIPGTMPELPAGFACQYTKDTAERDESAAFRTKAELLGVAQQQRNAALAALANQSDEQLDAATPAPINSYAPTVGAVFSLLGSHWMMHSGQWVVVRRQLGWLPLF